MGCLTLVGWAAFLAVIMLPAAVAQVTLTVATDEPYKVGQPIVIIYGFVVAGELNPPSTIRAGQLQFKLQAPGTAEGIEYRAVPKQPGTFKLPAREWKVSGQRLKSPGKIFQVQPAADASLSTARADASPIPKARTFDPRRNLLDRAPAFATPPPTRGAPLPPDPPAGIAFRESFAAPPQVALTNVFLGEVVPVTMKFFLRADRAFEDLLRPSYSGNGFYSGPVDELPPATVTTNGGLFHQITLQTTIEPLRTGSLEIAGVVLHGRETIGSPGPGGEPPRWTNFSLPSAPLRFEVSPLPTERPDNFTGGVGQFVALHPTVDPVRPEEGQPVTLRLRVQGQGNFRVMQRPVLDPTTTDGWRVYDAGETIERDPEHGSVTKVFEFQLIAVKDRDESPRASMSYFDPAKKEFVSLDFRSEPVKAVAASPAQPSVTPAAAPGPVAPAAPAGREADSAPLLRSPWFVGLQILVLLLVSSWLVLSMARRRAARGAEGRRARLQAEYDEAFAAMRSSASGRADFYAAAARAVLARLALLHGKPLGADETDRALERLVPNLVLREDLSAILRTSDELNYGAAESGILTSAERERARQLLEEFDETCR